MRFSEFATHPQPEKVNLRTCTLYVPAGQFPELTACRLAHGRPTRLVAVRSLAPRVTGCSVDVLCDSAEEAVDLLVAWTTSNGATTPAMQSRPA